MNLQLITIINEFLSKPAKDKDMNKLCRYNIKNKMCLEIECENCLVGRCISDVAKTVHTRLNQIQVTCEYTLTSNSK